MKLVLVRHSQGASIMDSENPRPQDGVAFDADQTWKTPTVDSDVTWPTAERRSREEPHPAADDVHA